MEGQVVGEDGLEGFHFHSLLFRGIHDARIGGKRTGKRLEGAAGKRRLRIDVANNVGFLT